MNRTPALETSKNFAGARVDCLSILQPLFSVKNILICVRIDYDAHSVSIEAVHCYFSCCSAMQFICRKRVTVGLMGSHTTIMGPRQVQRSPTSDSSWWRSDVIPKLRILAQNVKKKNWNSIPMYTVFQKNNPLCCRAGVSYLYLVKHCPMLIFLVNIIIREMLAYNETFNPLLAFVSVLANKNCKFDAFLCLFSENSFLVAKWNCSSSWFRVPASNLSKKSFKMSTFE